MSIRHFSFKVVASLFCALAFAWAGAAQAHVFPRTQVPAAGAAVTSPAEVRIVFDGPLEPAFSTLTITDASGKQVSTAKASVDPQHADTISVSVPALPPGHYIVHWVAIADDGHRTHGDYGFEVK